MIALAQTSAPVRRSRGPLEGGSRWFWQQDGVVSIRGGALAEIRIERATSGLEAESAHKLGRVVDEVLELLEVDDGLSGIGFTLRAFTFESFRAVPVA